MSDLTTQSNTGGAALTGQVIVANMTPAEMLALHDRKIGGDPVTDEERAAADNILLAAQFGIQAFHQHPGCDGGATIAMLRAFLTALVDPLRPGLDYLRPDSASGAAARAARPSDTGGNVGE